MRVQAILLLIGAWLPLVVTIGTLWFSIRLLSVPAGSDIPWRWAWRSLAIGVLSIGLLWLRNALVVSGMSPESLWVIQWLLNLPLRVALSTLAAVGFFGCAFSCYQIFKPRPPNPPMPTAQIVMNYQGLIIRWNPVATELLGFTMNEAIDHELATLIIPEDAMVPYGPDHELIPAREAHRRGLEEFHRTGRSALLDTVFDTNALHKDGSLVPVTVNLTTHMTPDHGLTFQGVITPPAKGVKL